MRSVLCSHRDAVVRDEVRVLGRRPFDDRHASTAVQPGPVPHSRTRFDPATPTESAVERQAIWCAAKTPDETEVDLR